MKLWPLIAVLALLTACNAADVRDSKMLFPSLDDFGQGNFGNFLGGTVTVNAAAREAIDEWELESDVSVTHSDTYPQGELAMAVGLLQEVASDGLSEATARATWSNVDIAGCDGDGFQAQEDGGCVVGVILLFSMNMQSIYSINLSAKGWLNDSPGDPDTFDVTVDLVEAEPE